MRHYWTLLWVTGLAACGGGSGSGISQPDPANSASETPLPTAKTVAYRSSGAGCIVASNADQSVDYLMGDKLARYLLWNCANHEQHTLRQIRMSLLYDYTDQCYKPDSTVVDFAHCTGTPPAPPANPLFEVSVTDFRATPQRNSNGLPGFSYVATLSNTGNVPAFNVQFSVAIDHDLGGNQGSFNIIEPAQTRSTEEYRVFSAAAAGSRLLLTLNVTDAFGNLITLRHTNVTVPR
jgi:hypothetical protein